MASVQDCRLISRETEIGVGADNAQTLVYRIKTDGPMSHLDIYAQAITATPHPLPQLYSAVEVGYVLKIRFSQQTEHNWTKYRAYVTIGKTTGSAAGGTVPTTGYTVPLSREPVMWIERGSESLPVTKDRNGSSITNSAGQPFDEPVFRDRPTSIFVVRRYYDSLVAIDNLNAYYDDTVSTEALLARAAGELRYLGTETSEPVIEDGVPYWVGLTKVAARKGGWKVELLDRGWMERDNDGDLVDIVDANKLPIVEPVLLDGGKRLAVGGTGKFLPFDIYPVKAYAPLFDVDRTALDAITNPSP